MSLFLWCLAGSAVVVFGGRAVWSYNKWATAEQKKLDYEWTAAYHKLPECPCCGQRNCYSFGKAPCPSCGQHTFQHNDSSSRICAAAILAKAGVAQSVQEQP